VTLFGWATGRASGLKKTRSWFIDDDDFDWNFAHLAAPVVTTTIDKIRNGDIPVPAYAGCCGKRC